MAGFLFTFSPEHDSYEEKNHLYFLAFLIVIAAYFGWALLAPAGAFKGNRYFLYIKTGMDYPQLTELLRHDTVLKNNWLFGWLAKQTEYPQHIKAGKYEIKSEMSLISIIRMLKTAINPLSI